MARWHWPWSPDERQPSPSVEDDDAILDRMINLSESVIRDSYELRSLVDELRLAVKAEEARTP